MNALPAPTNQTSGPSDAAQLRVTLDAYRPDSDTDREIGTPPWANALPEAVLPEAAPSSKTNSGRTLRPPLNDGRAKAGKMQNGRVASNPAELRSGVAAPPASPSG